jgi:mannose-6-phosphate isomerase-like protein (cupin superfamily)
MIVIKRDDATVVKTPHGSELRPLIDRTTSSITQCSLAEEVLPPGCAVSPHHHLQLEEIYYIVSGSGLMKVGTSERQLGPGDAVYVPRHTRHTLENNGSEPIRLLVVCGPAFSYDDQIPLP